MWIRSQNKQVLVNTEGFYLEEVAQWPPEKSNSQNVHLIMCNFNNDEWTLGQYEKRERCIEILNQIQSMVELVNLHQRAIVFQMPEK